MMDGNEYKALREKAGMSQVELAGTIGVSQPQVTRRESEGARRVEIPAAEALLLRYMAKFGRPETAL